jgi:hypothetical protein
MSTATFPTLTPQDFSIMCQELDLEYTNVMAVDFNLFAVLNVADMEDFPRVFRIDLPTPNVPLLHATLEAVRAAAVMVEAGHSKDNPVGVWDQSAWRRETYNYSLDTGTGDDYQPLEVCGTAMCYAGWAGTIAHVPWVVSTAKVLAGNRRHDDLDKVVVPTATLSEQMLDSAKAYGWVDGPLARISVSMWATQALGINNVQASYLYSAGNSLATIERLVEMICAGDSMLQYDGQFNTLEGTKLIGGAISYEGFAVLQGRHNS